MNLFSLIIFPIFWQKLTKIFLTKLKYLKIISLILKNLKLIWLQKIKLTSNLLLINDFLINN